MIIHDVAVTEGNVRLVCVGTLTASADGLHPSKCRAEKQIIGERCLYSGSGGNSEPLPRSVQHGKNGDREVRLINFDTTAATNTSRSRVPVLHEVRDITLAKKGEVALVSYEYKVL